MAATVRGALPIFAAKSAKMGRSPWPVRRQTHFSARNGPKSEPVPGLSTVPHGGKREAMPRLVRISTTFAIVVAAYWAYALWVVPRIEPPISRRAAGPASSAPLPPIDRLIGLRKLFRPDDWEVGPNTVVLESEQVKFLVPDREYAGAADGRTVRFEKCTIIFTPHGGSSDEAERIRQAVVLQADKGAELEFDQPFDLKRGSIGRLKAARLNGRIVIRGEGKSPGPEDDLYAVTRDVQLTEQRVWAPHPIEFTWGRSSGRGAEMQIKFVPGDVWASASSHGLNIAGIESLEVRRLERLCLDPTMLTGQVANAPSAKGSEASLPIEIVCRGPFRFDLGQQLATFEDRVDLRRIHPDGPADQLHCDVLAIQFAPRRENAKPAATPHPDAIASKDEPRAGPAASGTAFGKEKEAAPAGNPRETEPGRPGSRGPQGLVALEVRFVEARGNPVIVRAPSQRLEARGEALRYDPSETRLALEGSREVSIQQETNEIRARRIEYRMGEPGRLGEALAEGPGWLRGTLGEKLVQPLHAQWKGRLHFRPDEHRQHVLSLIDGAEMNYGALGKLEAAEIHFWLNEAAHAAVEPTRAPPKASMQPDRMLARNQVHMQAAQLNGVVRQLEVWFEPPSAASAPRPSPTPPTAPPTASPRAQGGSAASSALQLARHFPRAARTAWRVATDDSPWTSLLVAQAGAGGLAGLPSADPASGVALGRQFQIEGTLLRARVAGLGERAEITELIVEGNVRFVESQTAQPGDKPLAVAGDRIHVVGAGTPHAAVGVTGNPARFEGRGLTLAGSNINLNAGTNRLWIDGPGRVELLMDRDLQGRPVERSGPPHPSGDPLVIQWQDRMALDGRTVRFDESVVASCGQQQLRTETLEVGFREPIRFNEPKQAARPEIETLVCRGRVLLEGSEGEGPAKAAIERVDVVDLVLNRSTGVVRASGPGRVISVRRHSAQTPLASPLAQGSAPEGSSAPLIYLDVRFQRELTGNLIQRQMVFHEQVRCTYVPVASWDARFDDDSPEAIGPHGATLTCDRLAATQLAAPGARERAWALEAEGNARAEGQTFMAQALRMTFDQAKGLLVLEGDGRSDATLYLQQQPHQRRASQQSRRILFWPATKQFVLDGFRSLEIPNLPAGPSRGGPPPPGRP